MEVKNCFVFTVFEVVLTHISFNITPVTSRINIFYVFSLNGVIHMHKHTDQKPKFDFKVKVIS